MAETNFKHKFEITDDSLLLSQMATLAHEMVTDCFSERIKQQLELAFANELTATGPTRTGAGGKKNDLGVGGSGVRWSFMLLAVCVCKIMNVN